jgi:hypothetical protein
MSFLASVRPILRGSASITITMTAAANDALSLLVSSKLETFDPETTDPALAALQAALALPVRIVIPAGADADKEFVAALGRYDTSRSPVMDDLQSLLDTLAQAQQAAKAATAKKAAAASKAMQATPAKKSRDTKSDAAVSQDVSGDEDGQDASDAATSEHTADDGDGALADPASPLSPPSASAAALFD